MIDAPTETLEQIRFVNWLEQQGHTFTCVPNSTYTKSWNQKRLNTAMGLRAGFPDLIVIAANTFLCIEMKRKKGGVITEKQKDWHKALTSAGIPVKVCYGAEDAIQFVKQIIQSKRGEE